jgi:hypothetical protein
MEETWLPTLLTGRFYLVIHPHPRRALLGLVADLALHGPVRVLDGGNWLDAYTVAAHLRQHTADIRSMLQRICFSRAFTCTQMLALVITAAAESPQQAGPVLVLDMLSTFHDENIKAGERLRMLRACLPHLRSMRAAGPVLVCIRPGDPALVEVLASIADEVIEPAPPLPEPATQLSFEEIIASVSSQNEKQSAQTLRSGQAAGHKATSTQ